MKVGGRRTRPQSEPPGCVVAYPAQWISGAAGPFSRALQAGAALRLPLPQRRVPRFHLSGSFLDAHHSVRAQVCQPVRGAAGHWTSIESIVSRLRGRRLLASRQDLVLLRHDGSIDDLARASHKFDVTALLAGFDEASRLKSALDFAEGLGPKPPQPRPRSYGHRAAALLAAVRSAVPALL